MLVEIDRYPVAVLICPGRCIIAVNKNNFESREFAIRNRKTIHYNVGIGGSPSA